MNNKSNILKGITFLFFSFCLSIPVFAQTQEPELSDVELLDRKVTTLQSAVSILQKLKVSGYIQTQYQYGEAVADGINFRLPKRANSYESNPYYPGSNDYKGLDGFSRFGVRRGFLKFTYEEGITSAVFLLDISEKGLNDPATPGRNAVMYKDVYLNIKDPVFGTNSFRAGVFNRPFGHEIAFSSSIRESPERSRIFQTLFPDERDLGAMLTLQPAKTSLWNFLKLEAGLFAGNGIKPQIDNHMDFIGHLSATKTIGDDVSISGGVSLYYGGVLQTDSSTFIMKGNKFELESKSRNNIGKLATRQYIGFDFQYAVKTAAGVSQLRAEYLFGKNPGNASGAYNFGLNDIQSGPVYMRNISGGYVIFVQGLGQTPVSAIIKYDWYNPNTDVSGDDIAVENSRTGVGDITMSNLGLGFLWRINPSLRLTAYYDFVTNETTGNLKNIKEGDNIIRYGYEGQRPDNVFTLRLQYKF